MVNANSPSRTIHSPDRAAGLDTKLQLHTFSESNQPTPQTLDHHSICPCTTASSCLSSLKWCRPSILSFRTCILSFHIQRARSSRTGRQTIEIAWNGLRLLQVQTAKQIVCSAGNQALQSIFHRFQVRSYLLDSLESQLILAGKRFWIRYSIDEWAAAQSQWYFFKLFVNGRQVTSWGTNARINPSGHIMKGIFDPSELWNYEHNGVMFKNMGLEQRSFFFAFEGQDQRTAATDGGLIEVKVYRARGRSRRLPAPPEFKSQDEYGIT